MIYYAIATLHVIVCIILVLVVLLQSGKGADLAGAFGGGATQTAFGSRGPASFLSKMTTVAAVIFMLTSIGLSMISTRSESKSILENKKQTAQPQPVKKAPTALPSSPAKSPEQLQKEIEELQRKAQQQKQQQAAPAPAPAQTNPESPKKPGQK
jgi:preprotein translocase subunit SecG